MRTCTEEIAELAFGENLAEAKDLFFWDHGTMRLADADSGPDGFFAKLDKMLKPLGAEVVQVEFNGDAFPWFIDSNAPV